MARSSKRTSLDEAFQTPWWLGEDHSCWFCCHRHAYEVRWHCFACDRSVCPECVVIVRETREVFCPECANSDEQV